LDFLLPFYFFLHAIFYYIEYILQSSRHAVSFFSFFSLANDVRIPAHTQLPQKIQLKGDTRSFFSLSLSRKEEENDDDGGYISLPRLLFHLFAWREREANEREEN